MAVEIEAKIKVNDLATVRTTLEQVGGKFQGKAMETNVFFDTEDRSLLAADEGLRLRHTHGEEDGKDQFVITFKGPRQHGQFKNREEIELEVCSFTDAIALIERLGFSRVLSFQKRRETWKLDNCKVELDELPLLGFFVEIEGPREDLISRVRQTLQLADRQLVKPSYIAMLITHLQERGEKTKSIAFGA